MNYNFQKKWHNWIVIPHNSLFILLMFNDNFTIPIKKHLQIWKKRRKNHEFGHLPENMAAKSEITHSGEFWPIMATERCRLMPTWIKPRAANSTSLTYLSYVHVFHSPLRLTFSAITCKRKKKIYIWVSSEKRIL